MHPTESATKRLAPSQQRGPRYMPGVWSSVGFPNMILVVRQSRASVKTVCSAQHPGILTNQVVTMGLKVQ